MKKKHDDGVQACECPFPDERLEDALRLRLETLLADLRAGTVAVGPSEPTRVIESVAASTTDGEAGWWLLLQHAGAVFVADRRCHIAPSPGETIVLSGFDGWHGIIIEGRIYRTDEDARQEVAAWKRASGPKPQS